MVEKVIRRIVTNALHRVGGQLKYFAMKYRLVAPEPKKINLGSGPTKIEGYFSIDLCHQADLVIDLEKMNLPFSDNSIEVLICISAINYFSRERGQEIIKDVYRVLKPGGIARFGVQDLKLIVQKYLNNDREFFFQKLPDGRERFRGITMADKINSWFYGYGTSGGKTGKYFYDFETLALLFKHAGFKTIEQKNYRESHLDKIELIDNRPDQMFFLEAVK